MLFKQVDFSNKHDELRNEIIWKTSAESLLLAL